LSWRWAEAFAGARGHDALLTSLAEDLPPVPARSAPTWIATPEDVELGYRLVPLVLGLRAAERTSAFLEAGRVDLEGPVGRAALALLRRAAVVDEDGRLTPTGRRVLDRGPGPFGIIEAYHPYLA